MKATAPRLGLAMPSAWPPLTPHLITPLLFSGPLYAMYLAGTLPFMSNWSYELDVSYKFFTWQGIRNYIMVNRSYSSWLALLTLLPLLLSTGANHRRACI